jgi:hypothetical protein
MVHRYYARLSLFQQQAYRRSNDVTAVALPAAAELHGAAAQVAAALLTGDARRVTTACANLLDRICHRLGVAPLRLSVLPERPAGRWGELHGLYTPGQAGAPARITVWMRTAQRSRVVAFRTFLRTLLHELCHHLDFVLLGLEHSFHTTGFYRRERDLYRQLLPAGSAGRAVAARPATGAALTA